MGIEARERLSGFLRGIAEMHLPRFGPSPVEKEASALQEGLEQGFGRHRIGPYERVPNSILFTQFRQRELDEIALGRAALFAEFSQSLDGTSEEVRRILQERLVAKGEEAHRKFQDNRNKEQYRTEADMYQRAAQIVGNLLQTSNT